MRKLSLHILVFLASCTSILAQKTIKAPNAEKREVSGYHAISVSNGIELILTQSGVEAVAVSADRIEDRDKITTVVENGVLKISYSYELWKLFKSLGDKKLRAYVSVINIDKISGVAGAVVKLEGSLKSPDLELRFSSGAYFNGSVESNTVNVEQSSGSRVNIAGAVKSLICKGSSGSRLSAYDLAANNCEASTSSGARVEITVNGELSVRANSGGQVYYRGGGIIRDIRTGSGGYVTKV
jgi:hypothetical protein